LDTFDSTDKNAVD